MDRRHFIQVIGGSLCPTFGGAADLLRVDPSSARATPDQSDGEPLLKWVNYRVSSRGRVSPATLLADAEVADVISISKSVVPESPAERLVGRVTLVEAQEAKAPANCQLMARP